MNKGIDCPEILSQNEVVKNRPDDMLTAEEWADFERLNSALTPAQLGALEKELHPRAAVTGWTGDPPKQSPLRGIAGPRWRRFRSAYRRPAINSSIFTSSVG
jgi:hypothetical protein